VAGDIRDSTISVNATVQGLQDITELMAIVERMAKANSAALNVQLAIVQAHLAGGAKSKADAKAAWSHFVEHVGTIAKAGSNVFELVARIAALMA
jgi:hypothetical protein